MDNKLECQYRDELAKLDNEPNPHDVAFNNFLTELKTRTMKTKPFKLDVTYALEKYNRDNPGDKLTRAELSKKTGIPYQSLVNYQGGKLPDVLIQFRALMNLTGANVNDLIKPNI